MTRAVLAPPPFVRAHRVCWELAPHLDARPGRLQRAGFDLTLHAQVPSLDPAAPEAAALHERLRALALSVLPAGTEWTLRPWAAELHLRRETGWRGAEVDLVVELRSADRAAARAIGSALVGLGIPEGVYVQAA